MAGSNVLCGILNFWAVPVCAALAARDPTVKADALFISSRFLRLHQVGSSSCLVFSKNRMIHILPVSGQPARTRIKFLADRS
jgi:hypothetical protein